MFEYIEVFYNRQRRHIRPKDSERCKTKKMT